MSRRMVTHRDFKSIEVEAKLEGRETRSGRRWWMTHNNLAKNFMIACLLVMEGPLSVQVLSGWWAASYGGYQEAWASLRRWVFRQFHDGKRKKGCIFICQIWDEKGWGWGWKRVKLSIIICFQVVPNQIYVKWNRHMCRMEVWAVLRGKKGQGITV